MMPTLFQHYPARPANDKCENAFIILCNAHDASSSFLDIFNTTRRNRNARGTPTDEEQDLLRAMLTFACAGLDSMVKQLIGDVLSSVIDIDVGASGMFKSYIERRIKKGEEINHRLLAEILGDARPRDRLIKNLVNELTSQSLQSTEELLRVGSFFNIPSSEICQNIDMLSQIFKVRNEIVHDMDIDFSQPNRNRRPRTRIRMIEFANEIFKVAKAFLQGVDNKLNQPGE